MKPLFALEKILPPNVIEYVIAPMLDVDSRVKLNRCLRDAIGVKLSKQHIEYHQLTVTENKLKAMLIRHLSTDTSEERILHSTRFFNAVSTGHDTILPRRSTKIRQMLKIKAEQFREIIIEEPELCSASSRANLLRACNAVIELADRLGCGSSQCNGARVV